MKYALPLFFMPSIAAAHGTHFAEISGHNHWIVPAAIVAVVAVLAFGRKHLVNRAK